MARATDHIHLANKNHEALEHLLGAYDRLPEWVATAAFYKSVQIIDALFVDLRHRAPSGHPQRLEWLQRDAQLKALYPHFRVLHCASCIARYLSDKESRQSFKSFTEYLKPDDVIEKLLARRLIPLEQTSVPLLSDPLKKLLVKTEHSRLPKPKSEPAAESRVQSLSDRESPKQ
jgi:hypothetical protein